MVTRAPEAEPPVLLPWRLTGFALLGLGACMAQAQPEAAPPTRLVFGQLQGPDGPITTEWQLPDGEARAWMLLQHGFGRQCANLRGTARRLAQRGVATLCLQADMADGAPALAAAVAQAMQTEGSTRLQPPGFSVNVPAWVLAGHSAGALFSARVGQALVQTQPERVAGVILLDPVGGSSLVDALSAVVAPGRRPVRALVARPSRCNAQRQALPGVLRVQGTGQPGQVKVLLQDGGTHLDAEGEDTEWLAVWMCGEPRPAAQDTEALRAVLLGWVGELTRATPVGVSPARSSP